MDFIGDKSDGDGGDNWSYKTPPTNQHPVFLRYMPDAIPVAQPTVLEH